MAGNDGDPTSGPLLVEMAYALDDRFTMGCRVDTIPSARAEGQRWVAVVPWPRRPVIWGVIPRVSGE